VMKSVKPMIAFIERFCHYKTIALGQKESRRAVCMVIATRYHGPRDARGFFLFLFHEVRYTLEEIRLSGL
jgi:hypothetical protein